MTIEFKLRAADGAEYPVRGTVRIGRDPACEIRLDNNLASRLHASVWVDNGQLLVRDESSRNGTYVNGRRLPAGGEQRLADGDKLQVIGTAFIAQVPAPAFDPSATVLDARDAPRRPGSGSAQPVPPGPSYGSATVPLPQDQGMPTAAMPLPATAPAAPRSGSPRTMLYAAGGCVFLILMLVCVGGGFLVVSRMQPGLSPRASGIPTVTSAAAIIPLPTATPAPPLKPAAYAANSQDLAGALAELNQAQLQVIHDLGAEPADAAALEAGLRQVAALAFKVGVAADGLAQASAVQDGASDAAGRLSVLYTGLASYGFAQALDAQSLRAQLAAGTLDPAGAAALLADYGARAWNPSVTATDTPGNPFLTLSADPSTIPAAPPLSDESAAALKDSLGPTAGLQSWLAAAPETVTRTVAVLAPGRPVADPFSAELVASLTTAEGQADGDAASQAALAALLRLGGAEVSGAQGAGPAKALAALAAGGAAQNRQEVHFKAPGAVLLTGEQKPGGGNLPAFPGGDANGLTKNENDFVNNVLGLDQNNAPEPAEKMPVQEPAPAVNLTITDVKIDSVAQTTGFTEAKVDISFSLNWQTTMSAPSFAITCGSTQNTTATTSSGSVRVAISSNLILYPGNAYINCSAGGWGRPLGSASATILVGNAAEATQRAERVETEYYGSGLTLTAVEQSRIDQKSTEAAQTQAVLKTQTALETEQAATRTAAAVQTATAAAAGTATAQAGSIFTLNGTYSLVQSDRGCTFADAPFTSGILSLNVDFNTGIASAHLSGGGGGVRAGLRCNDSTGDMSWQQDYSADFTGTVDANGTLTMDGPLTGQNNVSWHDCRLNGDPTDCPDGYARSYDLQASVTGTVDRVNHTAQGTWVVTPINLPTSGDWSAGQ